MGFQQNRILKLIIEDQIKIIKDVRKFTEKITRECSHYRTFSFMNHTLRIFKDISSTHFGFRNAKSTREPLFAFNCFLDNNEAFD